MSKSSVPLTDPLIHQAAPHSVYFGRKGVASLLLLIGSCCSLLWANGTHSASPEPAINMAWQSLQPTRGVRSMFPVQVRQPVPPMRAWQPVNSGSPNLQPESKPMPDGLEKGGPATVMEVPLGRRGLIGAFLAGGSVLSSPAALALIPDDEDSELLEKAKANRKAKIQTDKETSRAFLQGEGATKKLQTQIVPVQKAIVQLALAGTALAKEDVQGCANALNTGAITSELNRAIEGLSVTQKSKTLSFSVENNVKTLRNAANNNKLKESKAAFVTTAEAMKDWAVAAQVDSLLKGL